MGQYQTRTPKTSDEEQGLHEGGGTTGEAHTSDAPPVFGSPIEESESFLEEVIRESEVDKFTKISEILDSVGTSEVDTEPLVEPPKEGGATTSRPL